ncbi:hypothetical protein [Methanobacterium congolense]|jgi:predicted RNA-binding Zn-ribbon protein involved in translation (DUF1610 family)|uniref:Uncharacterized protein n=1 Tax=Methanobacterium congolense TaxID=118062 RepID=A0A1D3L2S5_9EURY|nr:hypothetical protein [Methanobacterium congolense]SCG85866.1 putative protein [Methanobacterium congolense]
MDENEKIREVEVGEEFRVCEVCGFEKGFHTSFLKDGSTYRVIYICPDCGTRYDVGLIMES